MKWSMSNDDTERFQKNQVRLTIDADSELATEILAAAINLEHERQKRKTDEVVASMRSRYNF